MVVNAGLEGVILAVGACGCGLVLTAGIVLVPAGLAGVFVPNGRLGIG